MQRIGRVDRRLSPKHESAMLQDHPELEGTRGKIKYWNFLPPDELNQLLSLYTLVTRKTLAISETLGIEGKRLLTPEDEYKALQEFNHNYERQPNSIEKLRLELAQLKKDDPGLESRLNSFPDSIYSGRKMPSKGCTGVFLCIQLPAYDTEVEDFTIDAGRAHWYFYDLPADVIVEDEPTIASYVPLKGKYKPQVQDGTAVSAGDP